ncbi:NAD(P)-dependent oxidoreductase [Sporosarcina sp. Marseille-Q4063]|uniref:NAD(P)-dependent oxidoreductase n=1 Tax=Sporosarcina sp. Marseille-Q4063 TaxID=2810514 RepID=UPI001BAF5E09|nr:NAD(P)-dependent oxidoreductase [Sporosarcina sp. Marseille-Q4063]QUW21717.1 NAD(P)-dependent oxidoreductase [Sporosarcina sp. Marseille-Q4063]
MTLKKIAFIGTGVMGSSIVRHLLKANYEVTIYTRTKERATALISDGAKWAQTPSEATAGANIVITMVGYPVDVEAVYFGSSGIFEAGSEGQIIIDMTTSSPALAKRIASVANTRKMASIDAPVSGGDVGAKNGTLSIMCGGDEDVFNRVRPVLEVFGKDIIYQGDAGAGQHTKMCNQIAIATNMIGVCEAIVYAEQAGLDPENVLKSISTGAAGSWSLSNLAPRMLKDDFEPGFYVKHFLKDMDIALAEAEQMGLNLPGLELARSMYHHLLEQGYGDNGTQVLYKKYQS